MSPASNHSADASKVCRNCGTPLAGPYCSQCGQQDRERIVPFRRFAGEQLHDFFSFDTRFFHTVAWLRRPGFLTNEYVAGRRVRYTSPLRLYLIISFIFFFTLTLLRADTSGIVHTSGPSTPADSVAVATAPADTAQTAPADSTTTVSGDDQTSWYADSWLKRRFDQGTQRLKEDETAFGQELLRRIPSMMFFLLPAFALMLKLIYIRRGILYARHFVFSLHIHALAFLVFFVLFLLASVNTPELLQKLGLSGDLLPLSFIIAVWIYVLLAMRRVYEQSWPKTLVKLLLLTLMYILTFSVSLVATAFITLIMF